MIVYSTSAMKARGEDPDQRPIATTGQQEITGLRRSRQRWVMKSIPRKCLIENYCHVLAGGKL